MRAVLTLLTALTLAAVAAASMFDLLEGTWKSDTLTVSVGPPAGRSMVWRTPDQTVRGTYQVTANKGQPHVTFHVEAIQPGPLISMEGMEIKTGDDVHLILDYGGIPDGMTMDLFDAELAHVVRLELKEVKGL
ncbi:MAG: hypothetical protein AB1758_11760 [Candidatus Eremiobacterota bacterium]